MILSEQQRLEIEALADQVAIGVISRASFVMHPIELAVDNKFVNDYKKEVLKLIINRLLMEI